MRRQPKAAPAAYSLASDAPKNAVAAGYRGALTAMRGRITGFSLDLVSDERWPPDVQWAVET